MIRLIEALNYRCLKYVCRTLEPFHVLVGPNATGKTTFLDTTAFLSDLVTGDIEKAISSRTNNFRDLVWRGIAEHFELAIELKIPEDRRKLIEKWEYDTVRYEVSVGYKTLSESEGAIDRDLAILAEKVILKELDTNGIVRPPSLFPSDPTPPETILSPPRVKNTKTIVNKVMDGNDNYYGETGKGWDHAFKLGPRRSALGSLPEDESKFPVSTWLKSILTDGIQRLALNSTLMRQPSPPNRPRQFGTDGANLPWVVRHLKREKPEQHREWISHIQTALPDIEDVDTVERPEDKHCYLKICYRGGFKVPSWTTSDGTLRLLALTLPAYLEGMKGVYLIEEPENGIHPRAVETVFQSLSSVYDAQILLATHSPVILSVSDAKDVLCFSKTDNGATDMVRGDEHPKLAEWRHETNLGVLFASGVLG